MSSTDQVEAVETLTRVASLTMGLQEQIEIIRIISPKATVLPTDTEFEIGKKWSTSIFIQDVCFFSFSGQLHNSKACWSKLGVPDTMLYFFPFVSNFAWTNNIFLFGALKWEKAFYWFFNNYFLTGIMEKKFWCPFVGEIS